jgi:ABC-type lipoprotein release transport system permease subunit
MIVLQLGWRNLWRRPRRSLITISAIASAYAFLIALIGLMGGLSDQLVNNGTGLLLGHVQVHHSQYLPDRELHDTLGGEVGADSDILLSRMKNLPEVQAASLRVYGFGLLSTGEHSAGAQMIGIVPSFEVQISDLLQALTQGEGLSERGERRILLGDSLAQELAAEIGSEVAVVTQAADGSLGNDLYRVSGVLHTGLAHMDRSLALLHLDDLKQLLVLGPGQAHEIVMTIKDPMRAKEFSNNLNDSGMLPAHGTAQSWQDLSPQLNDYLNLADGMNRFIIFLVALFAAFGVLNTMMMAVFERTREIGLINSLGMRPPQILSAILMESLYLLLLGLAGGFTIGALLMAYLTTHGWDLSRWTGELSMMNTKMDLILKAAWAWDQVIWSALGLTLATLVAAYLPARRAARMDPVEALGAPTEG